MKRLFKSERPSQAQNPSDSCETIVTARSQRKLGTKDKVKSLRLSKPKSFLNLFHSSQEQEARPEPWYAGICQPNFSIEESHVTRNDDSLLENQDMVRYEPRHPHRTLRRKRSFFFDSVGSKQRPRSLKNGSRRTLSNFTFRRPTNSSTSSSRGVEQKVPLLNSSPQIQQSPPQSGDDTLEDGPDRVEALADTGFASRRTRDSSSANATYLRHRALSPLRESSSVEAGPYYDEKELLEMMRSQPSRTRQPSTDLCLQDTHRLAREPAPSIDTFKSSSGFELEDPFIGGLPRSMNVPRDLVGLYGAIHESDLPGTQSLPASRASSLRHPFDYESYPLERNRPLKRFQDRSANLNRSVSHHKLFVEIINAMSPHMSANTFKQCVGREEDLSVTNFDSGGHYGLSYGSLAISDPFEDPEPTAPRDMRPPSRLEVGRSTNSTESTRDELQMSDIDEESEERERDTPPKYSAYDPSGDSRRPGLLSLERQMMQAPNMKSIHNTANNRTTSGDYYKRAAAKQCFARSDGLLENDGQSFKLVSSKRPRGDEASRRLQDNQPPCTHPAPVPKTRSSPYATLARTKAATPRNAYDRETWESYLSDTSMGSIIWDVDVNKTLNEITGFDRDRRDCAKQIQAQKDQRRRRFWTLGIAGGSRNIFLDSKSSGKTGNIPTFNHRRTQSSSLD
ncbi:MAG: hypothetical protein M1831_007395 [Alyxoria varia]|nr:MAG: hypothetical protein M1831_007395 [Alyxoria varia]